MALDEILKGLAVFKEGVQQFQIGSAVNDANKRLQDLNKQELEEADRLEVSRQISQELALRLQASGASAADIQATTARIAPSEGALFQAAETRRLQERGITTRREDVRAAEETRKRQETRGEKADVRAEQRALEIKKELVQDAQAFQKEIQDLKTKQALDVAGLKLSAAEKKDKLKQFESDKKEIRKDMALFTSKNEDTRSAIKAGNQAIVLMDSAGQSPVGINLAKSALLKLAGEDRITNQDIERAQFDPSARQAIARTLKLEVSGEALQDELTFYQELMRKLVAGQTATLELAAEDFAKARKDLLNIAPKDFSRRVLQSAGVRSGREAAPKAPTIAAPAQGAPSLRQFLRPKGQ